MQPFLVVNRFEEMADLRSGIRKVLVFAQVYLLALQGLHKTFCFGIIVRVPLTTHADLDAAFFELIWTPLSLS